MAKIRRYDEIMQTAIANMAAKQDKITDFNEGSVIHTILDTVSRIAERAYVAIRQGYNEVLNLLPYSPFKFQKKSGICASGSVVFQREAALAKMTRIPKGTKVSQGGVLVFTTIEDGVIFSGATESNAVKVSAMKEGSAGNIKAGSIDTIESPLPADVASVTNRAEFSGGADAETQAQFEQRFKIYINGLSGTNSYAIRSAALGVNAVRSVSIQNHKPPYEDIFNMSIYVDDGSGGAKDETLEEVKRVVEGDGTAAYPGHLAPGVNIRVLAPSTVPVNLSITAYAEGGETAAAKEAVEKAVTKHVNSLTLGKPVILSEIVAAVMALHEVKDVSIASPVTNIEPNIGQIARVGSLNVRIQEA